MSRVRLHGLLLAAVGLVGSAALFPLILLASGTVLLHALVLLTVIPVVVLLVGLLELVSGVPFGRMANAWQAAPPPLQIAISVLVVLALLGVVVLVFQAGLERATGP